MELFSSFSSSLSLIWDPKCQQVRPPHPLCLFHKLQKKIICWISYPKAQGGRNWHFCSQPPSFFLFMYRKLVWLKVRSKSEQMSSNWPTKDISYASNYHHWSLPFKVPQGARNTALKVAEELAGNVTSGEIIWMREHLRIFMLRSRARFGGM